MNRKFLYYLNRYALLIASLGLFLYFSFHILTGNYGLFSWRSLDKELKENQKTLEALENQESNLQNKVNRLKSDNLDPDLLEECARDMLNVGKKGETIIIDDSF